MKWAISDPARFLRERTELERLEAEVDWLTTAWRLDPEGVIEVDIDLVIHGRTYAGRLTYPDVFPDSPPYIRPRDDTERWTRHQYGEGGSLCLQWRADNWQTHVTGAELVCSAFELLTTEQQPEQLGTVPSAHRVTEGQTLRSEEYRFVLTPDLQAVLTALPQQSTSGLKAHTLLHLSATVAFISEVAGTDPDSAPRKIEDLPPGVSTFFPLFALRREGWAFRSEAFSTRTRISTVEDLLRVLAAGKCPADDAMLEESGAIRLKEGLVLLIGEDVRSLRVFSVGTGEQPALDEYRTILPSESAVRLPPEHKALAGVRFGIVGLGSMGSKVAISLARSGARRFLLVDDDYLTPGNLCRHELSWASVGVHKVQAVQEALSLIAAGIVVDVRSHRVAGQESALVAAAALKDLAACDILIDATANSEVFLRLAAIAKSNRRALCWGELFAGGYGGLIARARPDLDPNPLAVRSAIHAYCATLPPAPFQQAGGYDVEEEHPLIAYDSDVGQIATLLTRFALDAALHRNPSYFPYPAYLIGMRQEWDFAQPFDTRPIDARGPGWDEEPTHASDADRVAVIGALLSMVDKEPHADGDTPA